MKHFVTFRILCIVLALCATTTMTLPAQTFNSAANHGMSYTLPPTPPMPLQFVPLNPCRLTDTRVVNGGPGPLPARQAQSFDIRSLATTSCGYDLSAGKAYSLNVTLVPVNGDRVGFTTIWPNDSNVPPLASIMNSFDGRIKANAAIVEGGTADGGINVLVTDPANIVLDINGYFTAPASNTLVFYPLQPCRVIDTRNADMPEPFGPPAMAADSSRDFAVLTSSCLQGLVTTPLAYSLNVTVVPNPEGTPLGYLTVWPTGLPRPTVSTLNNPTGGYVGNAAIIQSGVTPNAYGAISVYATDATNVVVDINGYFGAPVAANVGSSFYPTLPCRVLDTRNDTTTSPFSGSLVVDVAANSGCPGLGGTSATSYLFNATVVPSPTLFYLTLYPDGLESPPVVSTLNSIDGSVMSNMAIVPTTNGKIDAFVSGSTELVLDASGYFAPAQ